MTKTDVFSKIKVAINIVNKIISGGCPYNFMRFYPFFKFSRRVLNGARCCITAFSGKEQRKVADG
jgi:hypothetical protein